MEELILGEYRVEGKLGQGSFGQVLKAVSVRTQTPVAIKFEEKSNNKQQFLSQEIEVLKVLQGGRGIPKFYTGGKHKNTKCMVMELLAGDLQARFKASDRQFSVKTVLEIAVQAVDRIKYVHDHFYIHRDIKPPNFLLGLPPNSNVLYLADFGLAKKYQNGPMGPHVAYREDRSFVGTACYASLNTHLGVQLSRRDDLESLLFVLCFLLKKRLPWQKRYKSKEEKMQQARMLKTTLSPDALFTNTPCVFAQAMTYIRTISFDDPPDYAYIKHLFHSFALASHIPLDGIFDWTSSLRRHSEDKRTSSGSLHDHRKRGDSQLCSEQRRIKARRSMSPSAEIGLRVSFQGCELSENSTYEGWGDKSGDVEDDGTVKLAKGPTIDRRIIPRPCANLDI